MGWLIWLIQQGRPPRAAPAPCHALQNAMAPVLRSSKPCAARHSSSLSIKMLTF